MKHFQPQNVTATYKAYFRSQHRFQSEDIYSYIEVLQRLADLLWYFMDSHAKEEMVAKQLVVSMGYH